MPSTRITWQDVLLMPEDGNRYEAIGGTLAAVGPVTLGTARIGSAGLAP